MKTLHKLIFKESVIAIAFSTLCFSALFFFFDLIEELPKVGAANSTYELRHAFAYVLLSAPSHLYELLPMTVLIGTIFVMSRLAQSSEFTILRTSGLTPFIALSTLLKLGLLFVSITFAVGDYLTPVSDYYAQMIKLRHIGLEATDLGRSESWLKDKNPQSKTFINVKKLSADGNPIGIRVFQFSPEGKWQSIITAETATIDQHSWRLNNIQKSSPKTENHIEQTKINNENISTEITSEMIASSIVKPSKMKTYELFHYIRHLNANGQTSINFEIELWKKIFYPLSCLVMVVLALPYGYLHFRTGNIAANVFGGVLIGISFFMLNNIFTHIGILNNWTPWVAASTPGIFYSIISLAAFSWLVVYR